MKIKSIWRIREEYIVVRADGQPMPAKDIAMYGSAEQLFNALQDAIIHVPQDKRQAMQKVIEQCMGGKRTEEYMMRGNKKINQ